MVQQRKQFILIGLALIVGLVGILFLGGHAVAQTDTFGLTDIGNESALGSQSLVVTISKIIRAVLGLLGIIAVGIVLYGGFVYMTAGGSEEKVSQAKKILINGTIGLGIILSAFTITQFVLSRLSGATGSGVVPCIGEECGSDNKDNKIIIVSDGATCPEADKSFVLKSITPNHQVVTNPDGSTVIAGLPGNNVVARAVFSKSIITDADKVLDIRENNNLQNAADFTYLFVPGSDNKVLEAVFNKSACSDGALNCFAADKTYNIKVKTGITDADGNTLKNKEVDLSCPDLGLAALIDAGATFKIDSVADDKQNPVVSIQVFDTADKKVADNIQQDIKLTAGKTYYAHVNSADNFGTGFIHSILKKVGGETVFDSWDGPAQKSDATYKHVYSFAIPPNIPPKDTYILEVTAQDVDHKNTKTSMTFSIVNDTSGKEGAYCAEDADCNVGFVCKLNQCVSKPIITNIDPPNGAPGNWITVAGINFGSEPGSVQFGADKNENKQIDDAEWVEAKVAKCGENLSWYVNYVVVEVPKIDGILESPIKIIRKDGKSDISNDKDGPIAGAFGQKDASGQFIFNNVQNPGLCAVFNSNESAKQAKPGEDIKAIGVNFGTEKGVLSLGGVSLADNGWVQNQVKAVVSQNMKPGDVGAYIVTKDNKKSNSVLFTVLDPNAVINKPVIQSFDPIKPTPSSFVTVAGTGFGKFGTAYLTALADNDCSNNNQCIKLQNPDACLESWGENQVIIQIPPTPEVDIGTKYFIALKNGESGQYGVSQEPVAITQGDPAPSLCAIAPSIGPAPLPEGKLLTLTGDNLKNSVVYFYKKGAETKTVTGWFSSAKFVPGDQPKTEKNKIYTKLPLEAGVSMSTGPIRAAVNGVLSNPINYEVQDCSLFPDSPPGPDYQCCSADGPEKGLWKSKDAVCAGEVRDAGYVWRFTTGVFPKIPYVVEETTCIDKKVKPNTSPSPWVEQPSGKNECLGSSLHVEFTTNMDADTLTQDNFKLYECAGIVEPDCSGDKKKQLTFSKFDKGIDYITAKPTTINPKTWYRVELSDKIKSKNITTIAGKAEVQSEPLAPTRPCGTGTAYCYTFKTGITGCSISGATILPNKHVTGYLGVVQDSTYEIDDNIDDPAHPLKFKVYGTSDNTCALIDVDGLGWKWSPPAANQGELLDLFVEMVKKYPDTVAHAIAKKHNDQGVKITAGIKADQNKNIEKDITAEAVLYIDLLDPTVSYFEPACLESCVNPQIFVNFNRHMDVSTYQSGFAFYKCEDSLCNKKTIFKDIAVDIPGSDKTKLSAKLNSNLEKDTYYQVSIGESILTYTGSKDIKGKPLIPKSWVFKTQNNDTPCTIGSLVIDPGKYTAKQVGSKKTYFVTPYTSSNACSKTGQALNKWEFEYAWSTPEDKSSKKIAEVTHFKKTSLDKLNPACGVSCLPNGSDILRDASKLEKGMCGNKQIDPGEDCDFTMPGEIAGKSCTYGCLRPGNTDSNTCGNGKVEKELGEECEPLDDKGVKIADHEFCTNSCTWKGSTPFEQGKIKSNCGDGKVTAGEECDPGTDAEGNVIATNPYCSATCTNIGRPLAKVWCEDQIQAPKECATSVSVCGNVGDGKEIDNAFLEDDEECEIIYDTGAKKYGLAIRGVAGLILLSDTPDSLKNYCGNSCRLTNGCDLNLKVPGNIKGDIGGFYCEKGAEGCTNSCLIAGSSIGYSVPSLCGDGVAGIGEYAFDKNNTCEIPKELLGSYDAPVQVATAKGEALQQSATSTQKTKIKVTLANDAGIFAEGDYALQCGFTEYDPIVPGDVFNDCPDAGQGVSQTNSCCYPRPKRTLVYPKDGAGMGIEEGVCRNTAIYATFDKEIEPNSVQGGNVVLVRGYSEDKYTCQESKFEADITGVVQNILAYNTTLAPSNWLQKLWFGIKKTVAGLFGTEIQATNFGNYLKNTAKIKVWCALPTSVDIEVFSPKNAEGLILESSVFVNIKELLDPGAIYGVLFKSGPSGVQDVNKVSIANTDSQKVRDDLWVFKTKPFTNMDDGICKINTVTVIPSSQLFDKPSQSKLFQAEVYTKTKAKIVSTPAYAWNWNWEPKDNPIFNIPAGEVGFNASKLSIASKNVQGKLSAAVSAIVTKDASIVNNHTGKTFSATTDLTANFCERPWPAYEKGGASWKPYQDGKFNFSFQYCADAGVSGEIGDDLPYLKLVVPGGNKCSITGDSCVSGKDCGLTGAWPSSHTAKVDYEFAGKKVYVFDEIKDYNGVCVKAVLDPKNIVCKDSYDCPDPNYPSCGYKEEKCVRYEFPSKPIGTQSNTCNDPVYTQAIKQSTLIDAAVKTQSCVEDIEYKKQANIPDEADLLQKLFFFNDKNDDAVGLRIFKNPLRLSAGDWYKSRFPGSSVPQSVNIAGYDGVTDGNNYYINAMNIVKSGPAVAAYNNIYVFSVNSDAQSGTKNVFDTIIKSLEFNTNMSDNGYCVAKDVLPADVDFMKEITDSVLYPLTDVSCGSDFECREPDGAAKTGTNGVCSNAKTKFLRDWTRLGQVQGIQQLIKSYVDQPDVTKYPELKSGTYIPGVALSRWAAWGGLGQTVGGALPTDPINEWTACTNANQQTCWDETNTKLVCPAKSSVYEYVFVDDGSGTGSYELHVPFEYFTNKAAIGSQFAKEFDLSLSNISLNPYCAPLSEYSGFPGGGCGDGIIQPGEQCDPAGATQVDKENKCNPKPGQVSVATCQNDCTWKYECSNIGSCGNGVVEGAEVCDDGELNGTYGHCSDGKKGSALGPVVPACMGPFIGYCGNGYWDSEEVCDASYKLGKIKWQPWALTKEQSCGPTCLGPGGYCGDGILQKEVNPVTYSGGFTQYDTGEQCDDGNNINGDGCSTVCTKESQACLDKKPQFIYVDKVKTSRFYITRLSDSEFSNAEKNVYSGQKVFYPSQEHIAECFESTGNAICYAATKQPCESVSLTRKKIVEDGKVSIDLLKLSCDINLKSFFDDVLNKVPDSRFDVDCVGQYNPPKQIEPVPSVKKGCGNAKVETTQDGALYNEACDEGTQNGVTCTPTYGNSCTYCAQDCKKIFTVDPTQYCGNGNIEKDNNEKCDFKGSFDNQTQVFGLDDAGKTKTLTCPDKGKYSCLAQCQEPYAGCVTCGDKSKGSEVRVSLLNPMFSPFLGKDLNISSTQIVQSGFVRKDPPSKAGGYELLAKRTFFYNPAVPSPGDVGDFVKGFIYPVLGKSEYKTKFTIETNLICNPDNSGNGGYGVVFGGFGGGNSPAVNISESNLVSTAVLQGKTDVFEFPVNNEIGASVSNEYIYSPAVPPSTYRVVVDWGAEEFAKELTFVGGLYSESFDEKNKYVNAADLQFCGEAEVKVEGATLIDQKTSIQKYWWPTKKCNSLEGVYVHPIIDGQKNHIQSFTIDASKMKVGIPYAFYVKTISDGTVDEGGKLKEGKIGPIGYYSDFANPKVLVYDHHTGQDATYSVYKPRTEFSLKAAADKAGSLGVNPGARFWYVFNLVKSSDGSIKIEPVEKIKTDLNFLEEEYQKSFNPVKEQPAGGGGGGGAQIPKDEQKTSNTLAVQGDIGAQSIFLDSQTGPSVMNPDDAMVLFKFTASFNLSWDLQGVLVRSEEELKNKYCPANSTPLQCYKTLSDNPPVVINESEGNEDGIDIQKYQKYMFFDLLEGVTYRFVISLIDLKSFDKSEGLLSDFIDYYSVPKVDVYTGMPNTADGNKLKTELFATLDKNTDVGQNTTKWYVFRVVRKGNTLTFTKVNKFLPKGTLSKDYKNYD